MAAAPGTKSRSGARPRVSSGADVGGSDAEAQAPHPFLICRPPGHPRALGSSVDKTPSTQGPSEDQTVWFKNGTQNLSGNGQRVSVFVSVGGGPCRTQLCIAVRKGAPSLPLVTTGRSLSGLG